MRLLEIVSPEDQLAVWKLISDNVWAAFARKGLGGAASSTPAAQNMVKPVAPAPARPIPAPAVARGKAKKVKGVRKPIPAKAPKIPKAAPPKPLPKQAPQPLTPLQAKTQQSSQNNQLAQAIAKNMRAPQKPQPHPGAPKPLPGNIISPIDPTRPRQPWEEDLPKNKRRQPPQSALPVH